LEWSPLQGFGILFSVFVVVIAALSPQGMRR
jgi:hypothetical protein